MNTYSLESFISFCDDMQIAEENNKKKELELSDKQISELRKLVNDNYIKIVDDVFKKTINKFTKLKNVSSMTNSRCFDYNQNTHKFYCYVEVFANYAYKSCIRDNTKEMKKLTSEFGKDLSLFKKQFNDALKKKEIIVSFEDSEQRDITEYISFIKECIDDYERVPSNPINLIVTIDKSALDSIVPSENQIQEAEREKYLKLYKEFIKFLKSPHPLNNTLWSGVISDICKIIDMSPHQLNSIISKNIKNVSSNLKLNKNNSEFGDFLINKLGDCYLIESSDANAIVYSINKKGLYWINFEHEDCELFYENYPYSSNEFEEIVFSHDKTEKTKIKQIFDEYNKKMGIVFKNGV